MTPKMIDRVAKALKVFEAGWLLDTACVNASGREYERARARAVIAAMREPTYDMSDYAFMTVDIEGHSQRTLMEAGWRAMIDAALAQSDRHRNGGDALAAPVSGAN